MRKILGYFFIVIGLICLPKALSTPSGREAFGGIVGLLLFCGLPAYFLLRK